MQRNTPHGPGFSFHFLVTRTKKVNVKKKTLTTLRILLLWETNEYGINGYKVLYIKHYRRATRIYHIAQGTRGFPDGSLGKGIYLQCSKSGFDPWVGKIPWRRKWHPLLYSCLRNPMDRRAWQATVHGVPKSRRRLSNFTFTFLLPVRVVLGVEYSCLVATPELLI